jgi:hypothetical protein
MTTMLLQLLIENKVHLHLPAVETAVAVAVGVLYSVGNFIGDLSLLSFGFSSSPCHYF